MTAGCIGYVIVVIGNDAAAEAVLHFHQPLVLE